MFGLAGGTGSTEHSGKVLKMVTNPRMAGGVPAWVNADSAEDKIARNLSAVQNSHNNESFKSALAYQMQDPSASAGVSKKSDEFTFYDLLDVINPLQHIPLVNTAYRHLTGDEIKSAPQIIGGALFGGIAGAAGGLVNAIVKEETGKDIGDNALALVSGDKIGFKKNLSNNPEERLASVVPQQPVQLAQNDLPVSLLMFTSAANSPGMAIEKSENSGGFSPYEIY